MMLQKGAKCCSAAHCTAHQVYHPEKHLRRYCTRCHWWYHIRCLTQIDTVANLRAAPPTADSEPAWWIVWKAPARVPMDIADDLENLLTMPIQRGYNPAPRGAHPLLTVEQFTVTLRQKVKNDEAQLPITAAAAEVFIHDLLVPSMFDDRDPAYREAKAAVQSLARIPFSERVIYRCPDRHHHFL